MHQTPNVGDCCPKYEQNQPFLFINIKKKIKFIKNIDRGTGYEKVIVNVGQQVLAALGPLLIMMPRVIWGSLLVGPCKYHHMVPMEVGDVMPASMTS